MNAPAAILQYLELFRGTAKKHQVDAYMLAAICWRESRGGDALTPPGPTGTGDNGNGLGLMQVDRRAFPEWAALKDAFGTPLWQIPSENIDKGGQVLRTCMLCFPRELALAVVAYNRGVGNVRHTLATLSSSATPQERFRAADALSAHGDYGRDVLAHHLKFLS